MKTWPALKAQVLQTDRDNKIVFIRLVVGFIFMSEGMQKFLFLNVLGPAFFEEVGFAHGYFWAYFTGTFELACGLLVLLGLFTRLAAIPLLTIMMVAFKATKMPLLAT